MKPARLTITAPKSHTQWDPPSLSDLYGREKVRVCAFGGHKLSHT